jgi:Mn-containing catalase
VNTSQGEGDMRGSWNSDENFDDLSDREKFLAMDGGSGLPEVTLTKDEQAVLNRMARRTQSDPNLDPVTGVDLGSGKNGKKGGKKTRSK